MEKVDWLYFQVNLVCLMIMAKLWRTVFYDYRSQKESRLLKYLSQKFKSFNSDDSTKNLYLMMLDVDDFKKINDIFGHLEGDFALKLVADSLKKVAADTSCFISRLGGDEFVVVCEKENDSHNATVADLLKSADESMYQNKKSHKKEMQV